MRDKTLDRMCDGCVYGAHPDGGYIEDAADVLDGLRADDTHMCHRDPKVEHVCRGFLEHHSLGKPQRGRYRIAKRGAADKVDLSFYRRTRAHQARELVGVTERAVRRLVDGQDVTVRWVSHEDGDATRVLRPEDYGLPRG